MKWPLSLPRPRLEVARVVLLRSWISFWDGRGFDLAASLAYSSLLSFVPLAASITVLGSSLMGDTGTGFYRLIHFFLPGVTAGFVDELQSLADRAQGISFLTTIGSLFTSLRMFWIVESAVNALWGTVRERPFVKIFVMAFLVVLFGPVSLGVLNTVLLEGGASFTEFRVSTALGSVAIMTLLYRAIPRAYVSWGAAFTAGLFSAAGLGILRISFAQGVLALADVDRIYGSVSVAFIFVLANGFLWTILLFGVSLAHAVHFREELMAHDEPLRFTQGHAPLDRALRILHRLTATWIEKLGPVSIPDLISETGMPPNEVWARIQGLMRAGLVEKVGDDTYRLSRPPEEISLYAAERAVGLSTPRALPGGTDQAAVTLKRLYKRADREEKYVLQGVSLRDLYIPEEKSWP